MIELSYFDFVQKIRSFKRSTVLQFASNLGWAAWEKWKDYEIESRTGNELYLIRAHAGRIAAISAATGSEDRVKEASPKIIQQLCHDYISIKEPLVDDNLFTKLDFLPLKKYLETSEYFKNAQNIPELIKLCAGMLTPIRITQLQHESYEYSDGLHVVARNYAMLKEFLKLHDIDYERKYSRDLGIEPKNLFLSGLMLMAGAQMRKGLIVIGDDFVNEEIKNKYGIDSDAMKVMAVRFSRDFSGFRKWHDNEALSVDPALLKYVTNPLFETPLIQMAGNKYAVPSPWCVMEKIKYAFWEPVAKEDLEIIGAAFRNYFINAVKSICPDVRVFDLDTLSCLKKKSHGDFLIFKNGKALILELKKTVGNYKFIALSKPIDVVKVWERLSDAAMQCGSTFASMAEIEKELNVKVSSAVSAICCIEEVILSSAFFAYCFNSGLMKTWGVGSLEVVSVDELECLLLDVGFDSFFDAILEKWEKRTITIDAPASKLIYLNRPKAKYSNLNWKHLDKFQMEISAQS